MPEATTELSARARLAPVSSGYADVNGIKLYHDIYGQGEPLVMLHGSLMTIGEMLTPLEPVVKTDKVIAVELERHGRTERTTTAPFRSRSCDDIAALLN
jgi:pimeloyl-ACP methyl ester carboxylesterase